MYISKRGERQPENWLIYFHRIDLSRQEDDISVLFISFVTDKWWQYFLPLVWKNDLVILHKPFLPANPRSLIACLFMEAKCRIVLMNTTKETKYHNTYMDTPHVKKGLISKYFLVLSPILVLIITKIIVEICSKNFEPQLSWLPSFIGYYLTILFIFFIVKRFNLVSLKDIFNFSFTPIPKASWILAGVIFPALIPLNVFLLKISLVPFEYVIYILIFSVINPVFEESFWRGLLAHIPFNRVFIILYSAILFGFSHYLFWHFWFNIPIVTVVTVISTTVMGIMWMWFYQKNRNIIYLIISHFFVDVFNLSVGIYSGIIPAW